MTSLRATRRRDLVRVFAAKAERAYGIEWGPGFATFQYPNENRASTIWYHDHALGMTRLHVYAGPAGFYLVRGGPGDTVLDSRTGRPAALPGPAPRENDTFPPNKPYREIPIAIQDRSFHPDGSLFYPDTREFFDEIVRYYVVEHDPRFGDPTFNPFEAAQKGFDYLDCVTFWAACGGRVPRREAGPRAVR